MTVPAETAAELRYRLANQLQAAGELRSAQWRRAVERVPREVFLGRRIYRRIDPERGAWWEPITPAQIGTQGWLALAYEDETWVTQIGGHDHDLADGPIQGAPSSSSTLPGLVVRMFEDLDVHDGQSVLEVGTGTGYSAALMCERLGEACVTSIEVDPTVAERARTALTSAGYKPTLVVGDGLAGYPSRVPYDRIIATCSVRSIPAPWLNQCRPGSGRILTTIAGWLYGNGYVNLEIIEPGYAHGRFMPGTVSFMNARLHAPPPLTDLPAREGAERTASIGADLLDDWMGRFLAQLAVPGACRAMIFGEDGLPAHVIVDIDSRAYAWLQQDEDGMWSVTEGGPSYLWREVEKTVTVWREMGSPEQRMFTISITPEAQIVQLEAAGQHMQWMLPIT